MDNYRLWDTKGELFIAAFLIASSFVLAVFPIVSFDLFWHLAFGKVQFDEGRILSEEIFSHTRNGMPWFNHTWFSGVLLYLAYELCGYNGLILFKAAIVSLISLIVIRILRNRSYGYGIISPLILFMATSSLFRYEERPDLFSHLFIALLYLIIDNSIRKDIKAYQTYAIAFLIAVIWSNLHSAVIFGAFLIILFIIGEIIKYFSYRAESPGIPYLLKDEKLKMLLLTLATFVIGSFINPYGLQPYTQFIPAIFPDNSGGGLFIKGISVDYAKTMGSEFIPPMLNEFPLFWASLGIMVLLGLFYFRKIDITEAVILIPFIFLAFRYNRAIWMYNVFSLPVLALLMNEFMRGRRYKGALLSFILLSLLILAGYVKFAEQNGTYRFGLSLNKSLFPVDSVRFIESKKFSGNLYNTEQIGGYLEWMLYPGIKVFHDNRTGIFSGLYGEMHEHGFLEKYNVNYAVVSISRASERLLFPEKDWALVFWDQSSLVYLRRAPPNFDFIERYEMRYFRPLMPLSIILNSAGEDREIGRLMAEIKDHLKYVDNYDALLLLLDLCKETGYKNNIEHQTLLKNMLKRWPESVEINLNLAGTCYEQRDFECAKEHYKTVLKYNKHNLTAHINLGFIFYDEGNLDDAEKEFKNSIRHSNDMELPYYGLALISEKRGEAEVAADYFSEYLKRAPEGRWKDIARKKLKALGRL